MYTRYIGNLFIIWKGSVRDLLNFFKEIEVHPPIKFDYEYSKEKFKEKTKN